jgi:hypothetical protein
MLIYHSYRDELKNQQFCLPDSTDIYPYNYTMVIICEDFQVYGVFGICLSSGILETVSRTQRFRNWIFWKEIQVPTN